MSFSGNTKVDFESDIKGNSNLHSYQTRRFNNDLNLPRVRTSWGQRTSLFQDSYDWNTLDSDIIKTKTSPLFKPKLPTLKDKP